MSKKRQISHDYQEDLSDADAANSMSRPAKMKASSPNKPGGVGANESSAFAIEKSGNWHCYTEGLNEVSKQKIASADDDDLLMVACEHIRTQRNIDDLWHRSEGEVVAMGMDDCNQLGVSMGEEDYKQDEYAPTLVRGLPSNVIQVAAGGLHSVALDQEGRVYTWGCNDDYALGREFENDQMHKVGKIDSDAVLPKDVNRMVAVEAGDSHSLMLSLDGNVYMCGMYKDVDSGKFADVAPGQRLKKGCQEKPVLVQMPENQKVRDISAGLSWNAAILTDDSMVTWGMGHNGQLARSETMGAPIITVDGKQTYDLGKGWIGEEYDTGEVELDTATGKKFPIIAYRYHLDLIQAKFLKPMPPLWTTPGKKHVIDIACGELHLLVVARDQGGSAAIAYSSGQNQYGQLGHGDQEHRHKLTVIEALKDKEISQVAAGAQFSLALNCLRNVVWAWGRADYCQLGLSNKEPKAGDFESEPRKVCFPREVGSTLVREISAGERTAAAIFDNNEVYTWGFNLAGATGHKSYIGGSEDMTRPRKMDPLRKYKMKPNNMEGSNSHVLNVAGGGQHSLMVIKRFL